MEKALVKKLYRETSVFMGKEIEISGWVRKIRVSKGFGFIKETNTQEKYFVHINGVSGTIKEGDAVTFELEQGRKGLNAVRVNKV